MKKKFLFIALLATAQAYNSSAQNVFPATGNVGIGTTTPSQGLTVETQALFNNGVEFHQDVFHFGSAEFYDYAAFESLTEFLDAVYLYDKLGIGTSNPSSKFTLYGDAFISQSSAAETFHIEDGNGNNSVSIATYSNAELLLEDPTGSLTFSPSLINYNSSLDQYTFESDVLFNGDILDEINIVGEQTGTYPYPTASTLTGNSLTLYTDEQSYISTIELVAGESGGGYISVNNNGTMSKITPDGLESGVLTVSQSNANVNNGGFNINNGNLNVKSSGTSNFSVNPQGEVSAKNTSIDGTLDAKNTSIDGTLDVNNTLTVSNNGTTNFKVNSAGEAYARYLKVTYEDLGDYVFAPDYQRMSLYDLEKYVHSNRHLPGIPSCDEVAEEGMDVGEMTNNLLVKVEELTLYIIELQKQIDALKNEQSLEK